MPQPTPDADFAALLARAGLAPLPGTEPGIRQAWSAVQAMLERLRQPAPDAMAEPATIFQAATRFEPGDR